MTNTPEADSETASSAPTRGSSPYSSGGGGVTFERRAAVSYLVRLLSGATAIEFGGRRVESVAFQQAPKVRVDDLVVTAAREDGSEILELAIGVRRAPAFTMSDADTEKLLGDFIATLRTQAPTGVERRLAICVAGPQTAAQQVAQLSSLARSQAAASGFFDLVRTPQRFQQALIDRLRHLVGLVAANLKIADLDHTDSASELLTWQLLERLHVLMPRLEPADETDWVELVNQLQPWAREPTVAAAASLRDRLESLAASYAPVAAVIDLRTLRRDVHDVLNVDRRRREHGWAELQRIDSDARQSVRSTLGLDGQGSSVRLPRPGPAATVHGEVRPARGVLVTGESGVGKSALVISELSAVAAAEPERCQVLCLNLRLLPETMIELRSVLGASLDELLGEMSCPTRIVVIDAADVTIEREDHLLAQLLSAARTADVIPWVISATDGYAAVRAVMEATLGDFRQITIPGLDDSDLEVIALTYPQLRRLIDEPRAKELLRRPAVVDLFVRSGSSALPLSDSEALDIAWTKLVRNDERLTRGTPDGRDQVMRQLALQQLRREDPTTTYSSLDAVALAGLQHDALLKPADRWRPLPTFSHDLLRTYAVAKVLLSVDDPILELVERDAPRWALPAVRLAVQTLFTAPDTAEFPIAGRLARLQALVDRLPQAGHGDRWSDLPSESLLPLPAAGQILSKGWQGLLDHQAAGLRRLLRVVQQRHGRTGIVDPLVAEPVVELLLDRGWPSSLNEQVDELVRGWLCALIVAEQPSGHPLRCALRDQLYARVTKGDERLVEMRRANAERLAARTPEQIAEDAARDRELRALTSFSIGASRRRRRRPEVPGELTDDSLLEQLALLGSDIGDQGEALLRRVASDAPHHLAPAVEEALTGHGIAAYSPALLIDLVEAYYLDEHDEDGYDGLTDDGVRHHHWRGSVTPLAAYYRGPFLAMLRSDLPAGVACLNRLLNHAARARSASLRRHYWGEPEPDEDRNFLELAITDERRRYIGDGQVWLWYRGTGVGPYPCMSALQALEVVCDQYLGAGVSPAVLVKLLLGDCESLAMPALVVGMLVRHVDRVTTELDPFLAEPAIWHLEFARTVQEHSGLAARNSEIVEEDRRTWNLRDVSTRLTLAAGGERIETLRTIGRRLVERAIDLETQDPAGAEDVSLSEEIASVRGWAGSLDIDSYKVTETDGGYLVEQVIDEEVRSRLAPSNAELVRGNRATQIVFRYPERFDRHADRQAVTPEELASDIRLAREFADDPPAAVPGAIYDAPAAAAAAALEARYLHGVEIPRDDLVWAATFLVTLVNTFADRDLSEDDYSVFGRGADRAAARALPLLELPDASDVRERLAHGGVAAELIRRALEWIVNNGANETRLFLARAFDPVWNAPCDSGALHHHTFALAIVEDIARDCLIGSWDNELQRNRRLHIEGPVSPHLENEEHHHIYVPQLSATIRGAAAATVSSACCRAEAASLLHAALAAHRRGMHAAEHGYHHSDNDALVAARAILDVAATGDTALLFEQIDDYAKDARLLSEFLRALAAAGEETPTRAAAARRIWPILIDHVLDFIEAGTRPSGSHHYEWSPLATLMPTPSYDFGYLHREFEGEPIRWPDPAELTPQIERWLPFATGDREPVDALAHLLYALPLDQQAALGLPWIEQLVMGAPEELAGRSYLLPEWLERVQPHAPTQPLRAAWHRIVDALTVAGDHRIAGLAD